MSIQEILSRLEDIKELLKQAPDVHWMLRNEFVNRLKSEKEELNKMLENINK